MASTRDRYGKPKLLLVGPMPPPYIGPAVATERLVNSPVLREAFEIELLDTGDPKGLDDIGRFSLHNVTEALSKGMKCLGALVFRRPAAIYVPIDRALWGFLRDLLFLVPAKLLGVKVVIHLRAGRFDLIHDFGAAGRMVARAGLWCASRAVVLGETVRDVFGGFIAPDRILVVPNGMDLTGWPAPDAGEEGGSGSGDDFHIVYLANLFRDKGAHVLLQALPDVLRQAPQVRVSFAGEWIDPSFRDYCMELVEKNGLAANVEFVGVVGGDVKKKLLASADLAVFVPVKPEGLPWVVLEAMASGKAVIGTPQGTMKEVIVDGGTGYLIEPDDPAALAGRILQLVNDPGACRRMGGAGRARVENIYNQPASHRALANAVLDAVGSQKSKGKSQKAKVL